jgi:hypothetical protein
MDNRFAIRMQEVDKLLAKVHAAIECYAEKTEREVCYSPLMRTAGLYTTAHEADEQMREYVRRTYFPPEDYERVAS